MRTSVLLTVFAAALAGTACAGPDDTETDFDNYLGVARGANTVPVAADTSATAVATLNTNSGAYTIAVTTAPAAGGTLDSVALYQVAAGTVLPANATAILCAGAAACAAASGVATVVGTATLTSIRTSMRAYGTQVVFFFTGSPALRSAGGIRGTMYPNPQ